MGHGLGIRRGAVDEVFDRFQAVRVNLQHITRRAGDPKAKFNVGNGLNVGFELIVFSVFHCRFNNAGDGKPDLFLINVQCIALNNAERFKLSDTLCDGRG